MVTADSRNASKPLAPSAHSTIHTISPAVTVAISPIAGQSYRRATATADVAACSARARRPSCLKPGGQVVKNLADSRRRILRRLTGGAHQPRADDHAVGARVR